MRRACVVVWPSKSLLRGCDLRLQLIMILAQFKAQRRDAGLFPGAWDEGKNCPRLNNAAVRFASHTCATAWGREQSLPAALRSKTIPSVGERPDAGDRIHDQDARRRPAAAAGGEGADAVVPARRGRRAGLAAVLRQAVR